MQGERRVGILTAHRRVQDGDHDRWHHCGPVCAMARDKDYGFFLWYLVHQPPKNDAMAPRTVTAYTARGCRAGSCVAEVAHDDLQHLPPDLRVSDLKLERSGQRCHVSVGCVVAGAHLGQLARKPP